VTWRLAIPSNSSGHALLAVLRYACALAAPAVWAEEKARLRPWLDDIASTLQTHRRPAAEYRYGRTLAIVRREWLSCRAEAQWILTPDAPQPRWAQERASGVAPDGWDLHLELRLVFLDAGAAGAALPGGEWIS
jgi:hypothetical protein